MKNAHIKHGSSNISRKNLYLSKLSIVIAVSISPIFAFSSELDNNREVIANPISDSISRVGKRLSLAVSNGEKIELQSNDDLYIPYSPGSGSAVCYPSECPPNLSTAISVTGDGSELKFVNGGAKIDAVNTSRYGITAVEVGGGSQEKRIVFWI